MDVEKMLCDADMYSEKNMPVLSLIFGSLVASTYLRDVSEQTKRILSDNAELFKKRENIFKALSPEEFDIISDSDEKHAEFEFAELTEKFNEGFKLGALLMVELLGGGLK